LCLERAGVYHKDGSFGRGAPSRPDAPAQAGKNGSTSGATTAMLDRLEKAGLIERRPNPNDRRGSLIAAAQGSSQIAASWFESARRAQDRLISSYSESELEIISDVFERFAKLWDDERETTGRQTQPVGSGGRACD